MDILGIPLWQLGISSLAIFGAAIVRGFSGFGFSLLSITAITLFMPQAEVVPSIFLLEIAASLHLIPSIWREIHWRSLLFLMIGCLIGTPLGVSALASVPAAPMTLAMSLFVTVTAILMLRGFHLEKTPGPLATTGTGIGSGLLNGAFGIGGPPVIIFFFSTPGAAAVGRASVIAYFIGTDSLGLAWDTYHGLVTKQSFLQAALWLVPLLLGVTVGARSFHHVSEAAFRRWVLRLLILLAVISGAKAALALV
ncbi:MAG: sulfite exporter TauE/SafE family protein [Rhodospirillaceae bacterium]|nr:MAG: sulfite exporter TauE/SafE family protein [Rhodospirillaceae bacterium]